MERGSGVFKPAAPSSPEAQRQLSVLKALIALAVSPAAGQLGSSWTSVLRCLSGLGALQEALLRQAAASPSAGTPPPSALSRMIQSIGAASPFSFFKGPNQPSQPQEAEAGPAPATPATAAAATPPSSATKPAAMPPDAAGFSLARWAHMDGLSFIERVYTHSASLDGDAVIVFARALCAVSQLELYAEAPPRLFSLQKLVECAYHNLGRVRLVWSKLWRVVAAHLVCGGVSSFH